MKKLFTLIALLAVVLGAKAEWVKIYTVDYSSYNGFPFYVMGYVPEWSEGVMTDLGGNYAYTKAADATESGVSVFTNNNGAEYIRTPKTDGTWHQYFVADGIPTELDGAYTIKAMVKASEAVSVNVNMGWGWESGEQVSSTMNVGTDWAEVEFDMTGVQGTSCNLVAQPNTAAQIEWKYVEVWQNKKASKPVEWVEHLTNGDAETPWGDLANVKFNDTENNYKICAWAKQKGTNVNVHEDGKEGSDPFPAEIVEVDGGHAFIVRGALADTEGDPSAWDNQFWIQSPQSWKEGSQIKIKFRYKASVACKTNTQIHKQNPSDYLHWEAIGDVNFTTEWQDFEKTFTFDGKMDKGWSIAFNLNPDVKDPVDFYFDDLSWQTMKLEEGLFVASYNKDNGITYDFDNAVKFEYDEGEECWTAVVGETGKSDTWVNEIMISTVCGQDQAFKSNTIKPAYVKNDAEDWCGFTASTNAKIKLPAAGVWKISIMLGEVESDNYINFTKLEGDEDAEPVELVPNPTVIVINGVERDKTLAEKQADGEAPTVFDKDEDKKAADDASGHSWDNQFILMANRALKAGEKTVIEFDYVATVAAAGETQCGAYGNPGGYVHWDALGNINFTTEEQHFTKEYTVPAAADGMGAFNFNLAVMKGANTYTIKNVVWKLADDSETLIDMTGGKNFYVKTGAGTSPAPLESEGEADGISTVVSKKAYSNVTYNLAGQRVANGYKGIVIENGVKVIK